MQRTTGQGKKLRKLIGRDQPFRSESACRGMENGKSIGSKHGANKRQENALHFSAGSARKENRNVSERADGPDYRTCRPDVRNRILCALESLLLIAVIDYLFYKRFLVFLLLLPAGIFLYQVRIRDLGQARRKKLERDFREAISFLAISLRAGYSVENALLEAERDLADVIGQDADMTLEMHRINARIRISVPVEAALRDFAVRSGSEEIGNFASVFYAARKLGGNMAAVTMETAERIGERMDVEREIETSVAAKKYEQKIMSIMPGVILLYMQLTSPGFLDILYTTAFGAIVMTACLLVYAVSLFWGRKIVDIRV
ncbi:MAG: type II secretion system F family protein [Eubacteriales bacterium]